MPPVSSSSRSRLGVARLGRFRLGAVPPVYFVAINGVNRSVLGANPGDGVRIEGASITDELNHAPNTVLLHCAGFTPVAGHQVKIWCGGVEDEYQLFGGHILSLTQGYELETPARVVWECSCIDYTWLLNRKKVLKKYASQSATLILQDLISTFTTDFTYAFVTIGLPTVDEITFTNEDVTDAITRVMERIGGYWYVDFNKALHAFLVDPATANPITDAAPRGMSNIRQSVDLSQVATQVWARGGGSNALSDVLVGFGSLPVEDGSWYSPGSGTRIVEVGTQRITYTGVAGTAGTGSSVLQVALGAPSTNLGLNAFQSGSALPNGWNGYYTYTFVDALGGETPKAPIKGLLTNNSGGVADAALNSIDVGPTGTVARRIYRTRTAGTPPGPYFRAGEIANNVNTTYTDTTSDANLGTEQPPPADTTGLSPIAAGSTSLPIVELSALAAAGWATVGGQVFSYTGRSASSGLGTLTGIPASGPGSLTAPVSVGSECRVVPHLTGLQTSGAGSILYAITKGDPVNLVVGVGDGAAQAAMAAYIGYGDGIHQLFISDGRWSIAEATANATAELTQRKNPLLTVTFESRDRTLVSGRDIAIDVVSPAVSGIFKIQRVIMSEVAITGALSRLAPLRTVECSSRRYSFEDLLRRIRAAA